MGNHKNNRKEEVTCGHTETRPNEDLPCRTLEKKKKQQK